ncbi:MAG: heavy metal translocating P-type ATPase [Bacillota bacterium]
MIEPTMINNTGKKYILQGLSCGNCSDKIEKEINNLPQVETAWVNFSTCELNISFNKNSNTNIKKETQAIVNRIEPGIKLKEIDSEKNNVESSTSNSINKNGFTFKNIFPYKWRFVVGTILFVINLIIFEFSVLNLELSLRYEFTFFVSSYFLIGGPIVLQALKNIKNRQVFDENFLMTVATLGAFGIREFPEAVAVMLFYKIGEIFQDRAVSKSRKSIKDLMDIRPDYANLKLNNTEKKVSPEQVTTGDIILIKPGEKVPLDGKVIKGNSRMDTSALTGEATPQKVSEGDQVLSGTVNKDGLLEIKVTKEYRHSTVNKILELVENASSKKAPTEKFITKFARYYTPLVVYSALAIAIIPPLLIQGALFSDWIYRALIFLVISCPCALVVSIPLGFFGGIGKASKEGILIKGGNYLEALNSLNNIVFDKTGTLTRGSFEVNEIVPNKKYDENELLKIAAYAETHSNHPIAKSILEKFNGEIDREKVKSYKEISGKGVKTIIDNKQVLAGNHKLMEKFNIDYNIIQSENTIVHIAIDGSHAGYITISDTIKDDARSTISKLKKEGIKNITMLTGDIKTEAKKIANKLNLDSFYAELLPQEKVKQVENMIQNTKSGKLAFVGDGINDAPVLARSDIGVAMGGLGSDAAIEAADVVLMTDEPSKLVAAIKIAHKTKKIIWQNIILALGIKGIVLILGALGMASMWEAVFADVGVALLAVFNVMRILR